MNYFFIYEKNSNGFHDLLIVDSNGKISNVIRNAIYDSEYLFAQWHKERWINDTGLQIRQLKSNEPLTESLFKVIPITYQFITERSIYKLERDI